MSANSLSNIVEFFDEVRLMLATVMSCHDSCGMKFVLRAVFSEISEFRTGPYIKTKVRFASIFKHNYPRYLNLAMVLHGFFNFRFSSNQLYHSVK